MIGRWGLKTVCVLMLSEETGVGLEVLGGKALLEWEWNEYIMMHMCSY